LIRGKKYGGRRRKKENKTTEKRDYNGKPSIKGGKTPPPAEVSRGRE